MYCTFKNLMLTIGEETTEYEPYLEPIITNIYLDEPLRKLGDHADYIDFENQKVVRKIKEIVIDGDESIYSYSYSDMNGIQVLEALEVGENRALGLSNLSDAVADFKINAVWAGVNGTRTLYWVGILDKLGLTTVDEFKEWVSKNNLIVDYVLTIPEEETIALSDFDLFEEYNCIMIDTEIQPSSFVIKYNYEGIILD